MMKKTTISMLALMLTTLTACEKAVMDDVEDGGSGQVANALLQVRTRSGDGTFRMTADPDWDCVNGYTF